jgi:uncharacterized lipoprotein NlpE involved in copper resistance
MKKASVVLLSLLVFALLGCASKPKENVGSMDADDLPSWINEFPPEGFFWGIGSAKQSSDSMSQTTAEARARVSIARQIDTAVQAMFVDYNEDAGKTGSQANASLQQDVSRQITNVKLAGSRPNQRWRAKDGTWWYRVEYSMANARNEVAGILNNEEAAYAQFRAQQALGVLDQQLANSGKKPLVVSE